MSKSEVIKLIAETYSLNSYGVMEKATTSSDVFANVNSVTSQEWFEGGRNGLNPAFRFTMFSYDYDGEKIVEYNGEQFTVYRTYLRKKDEIELYCEYRKGNG